MTYLLDTHILLWMLGDPDILPSRVQSITEDDSAILFLSIATPWEIAIKTASGKLNAVRILDDFEAVTTRGRFTILETTVRQVIRAGMLPSHHRDPFDRLLAAQALDLRVPIVSQDRVFDLYGVKRIWD
jgi:PIN domain nuclease of toxin-antitoxin system